MRAYTGRLDDADRKDAEEALRNNEVKALVATSALGMGFDKPDLGFVVHLGAPSSPVSYYQQVGRAGRAVEHADVLLLPGPEDLAIWQWFATSSMPREDHAAAVLTAMADGKAWSVARLETVADVRRSRLELLLKVLAVDGAVERVQGGWRSTGGRGSTTPTATPGSPRTREAEQRAMIAYARPVDEAECRMAFLQQALDDPTAAPCGRCDVCAGAWYSADVPEAARRGGVRRARPAGRRAGAARAVAHRRRPARRRRQGQDRRRPTSSRPAGPSPGSPTWAGVSGCAPCSGTTASAATVVLDLEAPGIEEDPDAAFDVPVRRSVSDAPSGRRAAQACARVLGAWDWKERPGAVVAMPSRRRPQLVTGPGAGARPAGPAALPGRAVAGSTAARPAARGQQRLPAGRGVGPHRRRAGAARARLAELGVGPGAARRRPGRLPLDDDRRRPRAAPGRRRRGAAVRAGPHRLTQARTATVSRAFVHRFSHTCAKPAVALPP